MVKENLDQYFNDLQKWVHKELSWFVRYTDLSAEEAMIFTKNYPKNSEEDEKAKTDFPSELKGFSIKGEDVEAIVKEQGFFKKWNRPNKATLSLIEVFNETAEGKKLAKEIFGTETYKPVWEDLYSRAKGSADEEENKGRVLRSYVWEPVITGIDEYVKTKEEERKERAKKRAEAEAQSEKEPKGPSAKGGTKSGGIKAGSRKK